MKKTLLVVLVALIAFSVFAGGSKESSKNELGLVAPGKFTVATSPDYAPYEFYAVKNGTPELAGFDMALAKYIADYLGLELDVIPMDFDGIITEVQMGNVDAGIAGLSPSPDRAEAMDFSDIYYAGTQGFLTTKKNAEKFKSLEDTNKAQYKIGAQTGSIQQGLAQDYSGNADLVYLAKVTDIVAEVLNGKLDGAYVETAVAESYAKNYPELVCALDVPYDSEGNVVGIKKGNTALVNAVNEAIAKCLAEGAMGKFVEQAGIDASGDIIEGMIN